VEQPQAEPPADSTPADSTPGADGAAPTERSTEEVKVAVEPKAKPRARRRTKAANGPKAVEEAAPEDESTKSADDAEAKPASA
jgi:hypothetical protein